MGYSGIIVGQNSGRIMGEKWDINNDRESNGDQNGIYNPEKGYRKVIYRYIDSDFTLLFCSGVFRYEPVQQWKAF